MRVFVTGATGYIGGEVARAFSRAGHDVVGLCRSAEKAQGLARDEIRPVMGDITRPETYSSVAGECAILVHAAADVQGGMVGPDRAAVDTLLKAAKRGPQPKTILYTSGVWVHGNTGAQAVDETAPLAPAKLVAWRPAHEQLVLGATGVKGLVIRPGCVYGKQGGLTASWFQDAERDGVVRVVGNGKNRWAMVHVDDLADAYVRAAEGVLTGEVFNVTDRSRSTVADMAAAAARVAGCEGKLEHVTLPEARKTLGDLADCLALDQHVAAWKAVRLLGWNPRHGGFVDGVQAYHEAWKARRA
jgi:nucleoside-diphosphate-sugar epimerase